MCVNALYKKSPNEAHNAFANTNKGVNSAIGSVQLFVE